MTKSTNELVGQLADALRTLEEFEKFFINYINGRYGMVAGIPNQSREPKEFTQLAAEFDSSKSLLLQNIIRAARELNASKD